MSAKHCQKLFKDIVDGFSIITFNGEKLYIKHISTFELGLVEEHEREKFKEAKDKGLPTGKEKTQLIIGQGLWDQEKETKISELKNELEGLNITIKKLLLSSQIKQMRKTISEREKKLETLESEKRELIGITCESYSLNKSNQEFLRICMYKDRELQNLRFRNEDFDELSGEELRSLTTLYNLATSDFSQNGIKQISASPFFLNTILISKGDPMIFYGKPIINLTNYQIDLFTGGLRYKSVIDSGKVPPETTYKDIQNVVDWYEMTLDKDKVPEERAGAAKNSQKDGQTVFGANQQELNALTESSKDSREKKDFFTEAQKLGKEEDGKRRLDFKDFMELHGEV